MTRLFHRTGEALDRLNRAFDRRFASRPSWVVLVELFLGIGWLRAASAKIIDADWWSGQTIGTFVDDHHGQAIGWHRPIIESLVVGQPQVWAVAIVAVQLAVGTSLLFAVRPLWALTAATLLTTNFVLVGSTNPAIFYLVLQLGLMLWLIETGAATTRSVAALGWLTAAFVLLCVVSLPAMSTVDPESVIDDPGAVLSAWSACAALATGVARRRVRRANLRAAHEPVIDVRRRRTMRVGSQ